MSRRSKFSPAVFGVALGLPLLSGCGLGWTAADAIVGFGSVAVSLLLDSLNPDDMGPAGPPGEQGPPGNDAAGQPIPVAPELFDLTISEFYSTAGTANGEINVNTVKISEPAMGTPDPDTGRRRAVAFRFVIPPSYQPGNFVTLRLFLYRTGPRNPNLCFAFRIDARRFADGASIEAYGQPLWVRPDFSGSGEPELLVLDLPINDAAGLAYPNNLAPAQVLAFELNTSSPPEEGGLYTLLSAEVFESQAGNPLAGALLFASEAQTGCNPAQ